LFIFGDDMKKLILLCIILVSCSAFKKVTYVPTSYDYQDEVKCLAQNIYFEARDQTTKGQIAVALVTINRVESRQFPNSICKVIHQASRYSNGKLKKHKCHFSWYCDGKSDVPRDRIAWKVSNTIARAMLRKSNIHIKHFGKKWDMKDFLNGAKYYHRIDVNPYWNSKMIKVMQIGDHVFWKDYLND
jgi:spore germination cell wall hydrolase CwlJ-like protein